MSRRSVATLAVVLAAIALLAASLLAGAACTSSGGEAPPSGDYKKKDVFRGSFSEKEVHLKANQAKHVFFTIRPIKDAQDVRISVTMPAGLISLSEGEKVWKGTVGKGQTKRLDYTIVAGENIQGEVRVDVETPPYGEGDVSTYFLDVSTIPGGATIDEETGAIVVQALNIAPGSAEQGTDAARRAGTITIKGRFLYDNEAGGTSPMRQTKVVLMDEDSVTDETVATALTDYSGAVTFVVDNDDGWLAHGRDPYLKVYTENGCARGTTSGGSPYVLVLDKAGDDVPDGFYYDYGTCVPAGYNDSWQLIDAVLGERDWVYWRSSPYWQRPSKVQVRWPNESWPHSHGDTIDMPAKSTWGWTHVTTHHEYAHSIMHSLYGGYPSGWGPDPHNLASESSPGFAMAEGWAEYMQSAVDNRAQNTASGGGQNVETNNWFEWQSAGDMDGEIVEGSVASIFWDVTDPASLADRDRLAVPYTNVFTVIRSDRPQNMGEFWTRFTARWPALATSVGPLSSVYWHYGIDRDSYAPFGLTPPIRVTSAANVPGWTKTTAITVHLSADDFGSGVRTMRLGNYGFPWAAFRPYAASVPWTVPSGDGAKSVWVQFRDAKSLISPQYGTTVKLDTKGPTGSIVINNGAATCTSTTASVTLAANDGAGSGVTSVRIWNEGDTWSIWGPFTAGTSAWTLRPGVGTKRVYVQYMDRLANLSPIYSDTIGLRTATSLTASTVATVPFEGKATVTGVLKTASGALLDGKTVTLWAQPMGGLWYSMGSTTTAGGGKYTLVSLPLTTARYLRVAFAGDATYAATSSPNRLVKPQVWVTPPTVPERVLRDVAFASGGELKPKHPALIRFSPLQIQCYHYERKTDGTSGWVFKSAVNTVSSDYLTYSRYSGEVTLPLSGQWALRAYHPADTQNATTYSRFTYLSIR